MGRLKQAVAGQGYRINLKIGRTKISAHTGEQSVLATISSRTRSANTQAPEAAAADELVRATIRLTDLLNAVAWP